MIYYILWPHETNSSVPISLTTIRWSNVGFEQTWGSPELLLWIRVSSSTVFILPSPQKLLELLVITQVKILVHMLSRFRQVWLYNRIVHRVQLFVKSRNIYTTGGKISNVRKMLIFYCFFFFKHFFFQMTVNLYYCIKNEILFLLYFSWPQVNKK